MKGLLCSLALLAAVFSITSGYETISSVCLGEQILNGALRLLVFLPRFSKNDRSSECYLTCVYEKIEENLPRLLDEQQKERFKECMEMETSADYCKSGAERYICLARKNIIPTEYILGDPSIEAHL